MTDETLQAGEAPWEESDVTPEEMRRMAELDDFVDWPDGLSIENKLEVSRLVNDANQNRNFGDLIRETDKLQLDGISTLLEALQRHPHLLRYLAETPTSLNWRDRVVLWTRDLMDKLLHDRHALALKNILPRQIAARKSLLPQNPEMSPFPGVDDAVESHGATTRALLALGYDWVIDDLLDRQVFGDDSEFLLRSIIFADAIDIKSERNLQMRDGERACYNDWGMLLLSSSRLGRSDMLDGLDLSDGRELVERVIADSEPLKGIRDELETLFDGLCAEGKKIGMSFMVHPEHFRRFYEAGVTVQDVAARLSGLSQRIDSIMMMSGWEVNIRLFDENKRKKERDDSGVIEKTDVLISIDVRESLEENIAYIDKCLANYGCQLVKTVG
ncbi:hypothetical protein HOG48_02260 [Candidatus Peregrinibacteria bacterium]|jgi:hypothetical protein|nr:hypothetical protein [Candidatus Peregrinibacteria bacterium]